MLQKFTVAAASALMILMSGAAAVASDEGAEFIKRHEGLRLEAYLDDAGVWTVGYGITNLSPCIRDPIDGDTQITLEEAELLLSCHLSYVDRAVDNLVTVPLSTGARDALRSLIFNVGEGAFAKSKMRAKLNAGDVLGASREFDDWHNVDGVPNTGLARRRRDEKSLFLREEPSTRERPTAIGDL